MSALEAKLTQDAGDVVLYGVEADVWFSGDFGVVRRLRMKAKTFSLSVSRASSEASLPRTGAETLDPPFLSRKGRLDQRGPTVYVLLDRV